MATPTQSLAHNWRLKLSALGLSVFLWALVQGEPSNQEIFASVPVTVEVADTGWTTSGAPNPSTVELRLGGPAREIIRLAREGTSIRIPVGSVGSQDTVIVLRREWVELGQRSGLSVESMSPSTIRGAPSRLILGRDGRRPALRERLRATLARLLQPEREHLVVRLRLGLGLLDLRRLDRALLALALERLRGDEALNLRGFALLLPGRGFKLAPVRVDVLANVVLLIEGEQLANLRRALGPAKTRLFVVRETGKRAGALLDDHEVEHGDVLGHDAAADSLTPALTLPAAVTQEPGRALLHEEEHALRGEDTLLHAEPLLVVAAHDLEDVPFELLAEALAVDLRGDALVVKDAQLAVIVDFNLLLAVDSKRGGGGERVSEVRGEVLDEFVSFVRSRRQSRAVAGKDDVRWPAGVGRHARAMTTTGRGARDAC